MPNIVEVEYAQTGESTSIDKYGMREMQARAFSARDSQYLLIKAPPASGKSRALMFLGLDKLRNQGVKKVIVAVPEKSIGGSFESIQLTKFGFYADWIVDPRNNLCTLGGDKSKVSAVQRFLDGDDEILVCTHSTLRFAFDAIDESKFNDTLLAIDEFHHVSADMDTID
jgi:superfamily II DNA or RNA helicase